MAAHRLDPPENHRAHTPAEVERRLREEFDHVEADKEEGAEFVASMIRQFERMGAPQTIVEEHRRLQPWAVRFVVADTPDFVDAYLCFTAMPGQGLFIGYHSAEHLEASASLLERCADVLGYRIRLP